MKDVSNSDFYKILRLLYALSKTRGASVREKENARKAAMLYKKLIKKDAGSNNTQINPQRAGLPGGEILQANGLD